jgi:hypothetical protein
MGVLACVRRGCSNIMCDTYVPDIGYICEECQLEFKRYLSNNGIVTRTDDKIRRELKTFIDIYKGSYESNIETNVDDFFENYSSTTE